MSLVDKLFLSCFRFLIVTFIAVIFCASPSSGQINNCNVIAYYAGGSSKISLIDPSKITHLIYSFAYLRGNRLFLQDTLTVKRLVALKRKNKNLKVLVSFAGWEGCRTCSDVFSLDQNRKQFALSVLRTLRRFGLDGIDLDWEYPAVQGPPGQKYKPEDRQNFTLLLKQLRETLGDTYEISFAAGGFTDYLEKSVEWEKVAKLADRIHIMSYDLVNGYSVVTGHHTALYSDSLTRESADNAVKYLISRGVPANKIVIGAAFYGRVWQKVAEQNNGLYQSGIFRNTVGVRIISSYYTAANGYQYFWDETVKAPYLYNRQKGLFVTYDDNSSVEYKVKYVLSNQLNGIMFWQIALDKTRGSLLNTIIDALGKK